MQDSEMKISFTDLELLFKLEKREGINEANSCFDYIEDICKHDDGWVVGMFVEPTGTIRIKKETLQLALEFWLELFQNQPEDWDYTKAGWHLFTNMPGPIFDATNINPKELWK